jgi:hypothetical protein
MQSNCNKRILECTRKFFNTPHWAIVEHATQSYVKGDTTTCERLLDTLPSDKVLLERLLEKTKNKPAFSTLKKVLRNESVSKEDSEIAISSLITRCLIEAKDNKEYRALLPDLIKKLQELTK